MEPIEDDKPIKALFEHCSNVFKEMQRVAKPEETGPEALTGEGPWGQDDVDGTGYLIYEGHLTSIFQQLGLATPYYTSVMNALKKMGCVEQLRRGGGNAKSRWRLIREPDYDLFEAAEKIKKPRQGSHAALEQQVAALIRRVGILERAVGIQ